MKQLEFFYGVSTYVMAHTKKEAVNILNEIFNSDDIGEADILSPSQRVNPCSKKYKELKAIEDLNKLDQVNDAAFLEIGKQYYKISHARGVQKLSLDDLMAQVGGWHKFIKRMEKPKNLIARLLVFIGLGDKWERDLYDYVSSTKIYHDLLTHQEAKDYISYLPACAFIYYSTK